MYAVNLELALYSESRGETNAQVLTRNKGHGLHPSQLSRTVHVRVIKNPNLPITLPHHTCCQQHFIQTSTKHGRYICSCLYQPKYPGGI
jgi:hypothetical protein